MIEFSLLSLKLCVPVCKALIGFASTDKTRPWLSCIGINAGNVCATDGHAAVRFQRHTTDGLVNVQSSDFNGRVFPMAYIKQQLAVAKATKAQYVTLAWSELSDATVKFPPIEQVEPTKQPKAIKVVPFEPVGIDARLFARMGLVQDACTAVGAKTTGYQHCRLVCVRAALDPILFECGSHATGHPSIHYARIMLMPVRLEWESGEPHANESPEVRIGYDTP